MAWGARHLIPHRFQNTCARCLGCRMRTGERRHAPRGVGEARRSRRGPPHGRGPPHAARGLFMEMLAKAKQAAAAGALAVVVTDQGSDLSEDDLRYLTLSYDFDEQLPGSGLDVAPTPLL